jgi:hypothetical protein
VRVATSAGRAWVAHVVPPSTERAAVGVPASFDLDAACTPTASQTDGTGQAIASRVPTLDRSFVPTHLAPPSVVRSAYG